MRKLIIMGLTATIMATGCGNSGNSNNQQQNDEQLEYNQEAAQNATVDLEAYGLDKDFLDKYTREETTDFGELIQSFPAPVEISAIIEDMKVPYSESLLLDADKADNFETVYKQALGLGVYCADLGYLNVYKKTGDVIQYLVSIRKLTENLKLGQFFDFAVLKRAAASNNIDSLMTLSTMSYWNMDQHLRENGRANISALLVTGVWTESLYLACEVYLKKSNKRMRDHIASQKVVLDELIPVLIHFMGKELDYVKLVSAFKELNKAFQNVNVEQVPGDNGNMSTVVTVSDEDMIQVCKAVENLRKKITEAL